MGDIKFANKIHLRFRYFGCRCNSSIFTVGVPTRLVYDVILVDMGINM